jgi:hypothetical protein
MENIAYIDLENGLFPSTSLKGKVIKLIYILLLFCGYLINLFRRKDTLITFFDYTIIVVYIIFIFEVFLRKKSSNYIEASSNGVLIKHSWWIKTKYDWHEIEEITLYQKYYLRIKSINKKILVFNITNLSVNPIEIDKLLEIYQKHKTIEKY